MHKKLLFFFLAATHNAAHTSSTSNLYDPEKTRQLRELITRIYPPTIGALFVDAVREKAHRHPNYPKEILQLIEQGADPNTQTKDQATAVHALCIANFKNFCESLAHLIFLNANSTLKDSWNNCTPRQLLSCYCPEIVPTFDATSEATDFIKGLQKQTTEAARSPLLLTHLPVASVVDLVHEYSDDVLWDDTCVSAIKEHVAQRLRKPAPREKSRWRKFLRRNGG